MGLPVIAAIGLGIQAVGSIKEGFDRAGIANQEAQLKNNQADQIMKMSAIQQDNLKYDSALTRGEMAKDFADGGVEMEGSPLLSMEQANHNYEKQALSMKMSAEFQAQQLRAGGAIDEQYASNAASSGIINGIGNLVQGGVKAYSLSDPNNGKNRSML